jgi:hypothetical protein
MSQRPEYLILKPTDGWLPEDWWKKVLGSVVLNPHSPTDNRTPRTPPLSENDLLEEQFTDFILCKDDVSSGSFELEINKLGKFKWQKNSGQNLNLKGKLIYVKRLTDRRDFWELMKSRDPEFAQKVASWVNEKRMLRSKYEVCWVVGLLMCQEVAVTSSAEEAREWEAKVGAPLGSLVQAAAAAHGVPLATGNAGDFSTQTASRNENYSYFAVKGKGKYVFALELNRIASNKGKVEPTEKSPKMKQDQKLGDDEESDVEPEDLILQEDLEIKDWENLLHEQDEDDKAEESE